MLLALTAQASSAVAAICAAISSILMLFIQRRNILEQVRPELILSDWASNTHRESGQESERFKLGTIRNVGRGAALNVHINVNADESQVGTSPTACMSTIRLPGIASGEDVQVTEEGMLYWKNARSIGHDHKLMNISVELTCWDSRKIRHKTLFDLLAEKRGQQPTRIQYGNRQTQSRPVWWLKLTRTNLFYRCKLFAAFVAAIAVVVSIMALFDWALCNNDSRRDAPKKPTSTTPLDDLSVSEKADRNQDTDNKDVAPQDA